MNKLEQLLYIVKTGGNCYTLDCKECILEDKCDKLGKKTIKTITNDKALLRLAKETIRELL